jgi:putative tricarboxylic transport membrane protein
MRLSDRTTGSFVVALGALSAFFGSRLPPIAGQQIGPDVFPLVVGIGLCICGMLVVCGVGRAYEDEAEAVTASHGDTQEQTHSGIVAGLRVLLPPALLLFYVVGVNWLGFIPTAALIVLVVSMALGGCLRLAIPLAVLAPVAVHLVFAKLLRVPLPAGYVPMPW